MSPPVAPCGRRVEPLERCRGRSVRRAVARLASALLTGLAILPLASPTRASAPTVSFTTALTQARQGPSVAAAELAAASARAARDASFGVVTGTLQGGYSQSWNDVSGVASQRGGLEPFSLSATFNVVPYGPGYDARLDAESALATAELDLADARHQATLDAAGAYLDALRSRQRVELDARALALATATLDHLREQRASGDASADAVEDAQLAVEQARTTLATERLTLSGALADLGDLTGHAVDAVQAEPPAGHDPPTTPLEAALERRSDVRAAALALESARRGYAASVRTVLPTIRASADLQGGDGTTRWSAGLSYGTSSFQPGMQASVTPAGSTTGDASGSSVIDGTRFALSLALSVPIDTSLEPALQSAHLAVARAEARMQQVRRQASSEVAAARRALTSARLAAALAQAQDRRAADRASEGARRFQLGLIAEPELDQLRLDADVAAVDARTAADTVLLARLRLAQALGLDPSEVL